MRTRRASETRAAAAAPTRSDLPITRVLPVTTGQRIHATVARADADGLVWIGWRGALVQARSAVPLTAGHSYTFTVESASDDRIRLRAERKSGGLPSLVDALISGLLGESGDGSQGELDPADKEQLWWCFLDDTSSTSWTALSTLWGGVRVDAGHGRLTAQIASPTAISAATQALELGWPDHEVVVRVAPGRQVPYGDLLGRRVAVGSPGGGPLLDVQA